MKKLTQETKNAIREAMLLYTESGIPVEACARMCINHALGLLEIADEHPEWFELPDSK